LPVDIHHHSPKVLNLYKYFLSIGFFTCFLAN
jgi:hypothetical protein